MTELFENIQKPETAVLVGVDLGEYDCEASLDELEELAKTAGAEVEARVTQRRETRRLRDLYRLGQAQGDKKLLRR